MSRRLNGALVQARSSPGLARLVCKTLLIAVLWLATRPYSGIVDDARLYAVQALNALPPPGRFLDDLYFRFGSQDSFTLFTPLLYKPAIEAFGLANAAMILTIVAHCLWVTGLGYLASGMIRDDKAGTIIAAMAAAIVVPGGILFPYGEHSLTPRLFAEALTLWSVGAMVRGHGVRALCLLLLAAALHPLMALPGLALLFVYEAAARPVLWAGAAAAVAGGVICAGFGIQPFSRIFQTFDPAWFAVVKVRDYFCLITEWDPGEWLRAAEALPLAAICISSADANERRILWSAAAVGLGGFLVALVGGDLLRNVFVLDVQTWRASWLLAVVTNLWVGVIMFRRLSCANRSLDIADGVLLAAIALTALSRFIPVMGFVSVPLIYVAWAVRLWSASRKRRLSPLIRPFILSVIALALASAAVITELTLVDAAIWPAGLWNQLRNIGLTVGALTALLFLVKRNAAGSTKSGFWLASSLALTVAAILTWDQRTPWTLFVETTDAPPAPLLAKLQNVKSLYWEGDVRAPWLLLRRPSYFSCDQGPGVLFSRGTALAYQARRDDFASLQTLDFGIQLFCPLDAGPDAQRPPLRDADLRELCRKEPELDALALTKPIVAIAGDEWTPPVRYEDPETYGRRWREFSTGTFHIYRCSQFR